MLERATCLARGGILGEYEACEQEAAQARAEDSQDGRKEEGTMKLIGSAKVVSG